MIDDLVCSGANRSYDFDFIKVIRKKYDWLPDTESVKTVSAQMHLISCPYVIIDDLIED
jgi:hypothetical protein